MCLKKVYALGALLLGILMVGHAQNAAPAPKSPQSPSEVKLAGKPDQPQLQRATSQPVYSQQSNGTAGITPVGTATSKPANTTATGTPSSKPMSSTDKERLNMKTATATEEPVTTPLKLGNVNQ